MKKFTVGFLLFLVVATAGALVFVGLSPDFTEPTLLAGQEGVSPDSPIWSKTMDDLAAYLLEEGALTSDEYTEISEGIASVARSYNGIELYWWDLDNLTEESGEYIAYVSACEEGVIDIWGSGMLMNVTAVRGPFALNISAGYVGDAGKVETAFNAYCADPADGQSEE